MTKPNNKFWLVVVVIVLVIAILGGWFYWFQWRPTQIRKDCSYRTYNGKQYPNDNDMYEACLHQRGLE
jgi:hypothetical protein